MMNKVKIDEKHNYTRTDDGKWLAGCSTISDILPKPWLSAWGAKETVKFLGFSDYADDTKKADEMLQKIKGLSLKQYQELLKEAKGASRKKSKDALIDGKAGHAWLETYVKAKMRGQPLPALPGGLLDRPLTQFIAWEVANVDTWILSEARVADVDEEYAGTLDGAALMKTGKFAIIDYKFAQHIGYDYYLQCVGYALPFEKYGIQFDERIIVRLPKTELREEYDKTTFTYSKVPNDIEIRIVDTDYAFDKITFLAARRLQKWINHLPQDNI